MSKTEEDKGIVYCNRVRLGNWYEETKLEEVPYTKSTSIGNRQRLFFSILLHDFLDKFGFNTFTALVKFDDFQLYKLDKFLRQMKKGDLMLAKFRKMTENLNKPTVLTQSSGSIAFGAKIALLAPYVPASDPPVEDKKGLLLGGRISSNEIMYSQDLEDGCSIVGHASLEPAERNTFVITSADYCNREGEPLKYYQEFLLTLSSSLQRKPLYVRYDPNPIPGLCGMYPLYLSKHPVSNTRWRILPIQRPDITRFEREGKSVEVNTDMVVNHCATNVNLGINVGCWTMGFYGKICTPLMKTCLDVYGRELPNNIWQIYVPLSS